MPYDIKRYRYSEGDHRTGAGVNNPNNPKQLSGIGQVCLIYLSFFDYFAWLPRKMVRIGMIGALSDTHFSILSRDCFNLSREYFSLQAIKNVIG